jgi:hypothetical protein
MPSIDYQHNKRENSEEEAEREREIKRVLFDE